MNIQKIRNLYKQRALLDLRFVSQLDVKKIRFHDLRHTKATYLIACGVHPKVIQEILGHPNFNITMNIYGHSSEEKKRETAYYFHIAFK